MHGEQFARPAYVEAFGLHFRPANAEKLGIGHMLANGANQVAGKQVARGFPGDHRDTNGHDFERTSADDAAP